MAKKDRIAIYVFADWVDLGGPIFVGTFFAERTKGHRVFSFQYAKEWVAKKNQKNLFLLDPDIDFNSYIQYPSSNKENFGMFLDSLPDRWGRILMQRQEFYDAKDEERKARKLDDIDFLPKIFDASRMGALRFKLKREGDFVDNTLAAPIPSWASLKELQASAKKLEADKNTEDIRKDLKLIFAPGTSLGGARPKANVLDENNHPWIAKFPSESDEYDKAAWEYLAYILATKAGINMSESRIKKIHGKHHTFLTKRFDRIGTERIHFASAMTMTGNNEETIKNQTPSYLHLAEFIMDRSINMRADLAQLWRRIVFSIAISNTDDHLRNHGFIIKNGGWQLSPAYDINPSIKKHGLAINIDEDSNALDFNLAKSVGDFFGLDAIEMNKILKEVLDVVKDWRVEARRIKISAEEQNRMEPAFRFDYFENEKQ